MSSAGLQVAQVFPRGRGPRRPVRVDMGLIVGLFSKRQADAARHLGLSLTAFKSACRKLGVVRWPYSRQRFHNPQDKEIALCEPADDAVPASDPTRDSSDDIQPAQDAWGCAPCWQWSELLEEAMEHVEGRATR
ncbi:hypothetical protein GUITHDRAFT_118109 [Guillardia theta CCMP2712]|uniref:RWP-RK domain-containing protein n=1 Tax=Guillardia theta (strain CCMP2712) TaxID=905079 RepID=L1IIG4_GUITC|nr:hypothetical protein GUITHDRAFT_118109 [Guillardia theta CCMP2712]EKX35724.1 hypothetical protein GUITHDRAFT_118109 [Guillardia theta CCMP2712]|eukprot:XP_005822704.1 hypothetical protein GUITHDRAFT_118109 [Guillardia theta CCMP2712]